MNTIHTVRDLTGLLSDNWAYAKSWSIPSVSTVVTRSGAWKGGLADRYEAFKNHWSELRDCQRKWYEHRGYDIPSRKLGQYNGLYRRFVKEFSNVPELGITFRSSFTFYETVRFKFRTCNGNLVKIENSPEKVSYRGHYKGMNHIKKNIQSITYFRGQFKRSELTEPQAWALIGQMDSGYYPLCVFSECIRVRDLVEKRLKG